MDQPINDPSNPGHFVLVPNTAKFIVDKELAFKQLEKELPAVDLNKFKSKEAKEDAVEDKKAVGSKVFREEIVRDIVRFNDCEFPATIGPMN